MVDMMLTADSRMVPARKIGYIEIPESSSVYVLENDGINTDIVKDGLKRRGIRAAPSKSKADFIMEVENHKYMGRGFTTATFPKKPFECYSARERFIIVPTSKDTFDTIIAQDLDMHSKTGLYRNPDLVLEKEGKYCTGISGIDKVLGGGLSPGEINLMEIGPTTGKAYYLFLQALSSAHATRMMKDPEKNGPNLKILSGGVSVGYVKDQFERLLPKDAIDKCIVTILADEKKQMVDKSIVDSSNAEGLERTPLCETINRRIAQQNALDKHIYIDGSIETIYNKKNSHTLSYISELFHMAHSKKYQTMFFGRNQEFLNEVVNTGGVDRDFHLTELADTGVVGIVDKISRTAPLYLLYFVNDESGYPMTKAVEARKL